MSHHFPVSFCFLFVCKKDLFLFHAIQYFVKNQLIILCEFFFLNTGILIFRFVFI